MTRIAWLGTGAMGGRMAARLVAAGHDVTVWNRTAARARSLIEAGAHLATTPREAAAEAEIVLSMLTADEASREVWLAPGKGAIHNLAAGTIVLECSTVSRDWIAELGLRLDDAGARFLDAPVAGSLPQAQAGQLIFMVGGDAADLDKVRPVLGTLGSEILHVGSGGQGAMLKLAVNAFFAAQLASLAELLGLLSRNGFSSAEAAAALARFPIVAPALAGAARMMAQRDTTPLFTIDLIEKDLRYVLAAGQQAGARLPSTVSAREAFDAARGAGWGSANFSALALLYAPDAR